MELIGATVGAFNLLGHLDHPISQGQGQIVRSVSGSGVLRVRPRGALQPLRHEWWRSVVFDNTRRSWTKERL